MSSGKINEFCQVTGCDEQTAVSFLSACNDNLEMAVCLFMDSPNVSSRASAPDLDDTCRSPIPQRTEQLLPVEIPTYGTRFIGSSSGRGFGAHGTSRRQRPVFLADDSDEDEEEEEENGREDRGNRLTEAGTAGELGEALQTGFILRPTSHQATDREGASSSSSQQPIANGRHASPPAAGSRETVSWNGVDSGASGSFSNQRPSAAPPAKRRRENLRQLYRPPTELLFDGNVTQALAAARGKSQWLLVSLHDEGCFDCHILNRDVWKDSKVFMLVRKSFTFIQISVDSPDGVRYRSRYPYVNSATHMAVLDPFTGEQKMMWMHLKDADSVYEVLSEFLTHNRLKSTGDLRNPLPSTSNRRPTDDGYPQDPVPKRPRKDLLDGISMGVAAVSPQLAGDNHLLSSASSSSSSLLSRRATGDSQLTGARVNPLDLSEEEQLRLAIEASKAEVNSETADAISTVTISDADENDSVDIEDDDLIVLTDDEFAEGQRKPTGGRRPIHTTNNLLPVDGSSFNGAVVTSSSLVTSRRPLWPMSTEDAGGSTDGHVRPAEVVEPLPSVAPGEPVIELAVRLPSGDREVHCLSPTLTLQVLLGYFASRGLPAKDFELIRLYPRVVLSQLPEETSLGDIGLSRKDTIFIQPK